MPHAEDHTTSPTVYIAAPSRLPARTPMAGRLQSPTFNPFPLGSNDDELERAQARAARAASIRRKSAAVAVPNCLPSRDDLLDRQQIVDLLNNCLKLASENKINQKNTWELNLIDHLSEIIQTKAEEDDAETNFQKASCTLEAGVKIYSLRVDSLHSEAYKVLGGINRVGREEEIENVAEGNRAHDGTEQEDLSKKITERKLSPLSTLETSFEALNVKKFDVVFAVDPLYHQTSAQFDEGGAKGLLLNNLGVYGRCRVLFDSFEVPEKCISNDTHNEKSEVIDLSFAKECLDQMMINIPKKLDISPTLMEIMERFGKNNHTVETVSAVEEPQISHSGIDDKNHPEFEGNSFSDCVSDVFDHDDHINVVQENSTCIYPSFTSHAEENGDYLVDDFDTNIGLEVTDLLSFGLGFASKSNAWAGPDYWKYKKSKGSEQISELVDKKESTKKPKAKKTSSDIEFAKFLDKEYPDMFALPKNPRSLLLPFNRATCNITLPEDCHYKPENLAKLFLIPDVMIFGKRSRKLHAVPEETNKDDIPCASSDQGNIFDDQFGDGNSDCDMDGSESLVQLPRQVNKIDIQYDKVSKQVDVHALKETLWTHIQETFDLGREVSVSMKQVLHRLHRTFSADAQKDISPHLFFICLLHLANEHALVLRQYPTLDDIDIGIPASDQ